MSCPKCGSNNITTNNKGYGIGKGIIGAALIGPIGLVAGNIGKNDIICTCLDCGHTWLLKDQIQQEKEIEIEKIFTNDKPKDGPIYTGCLLFIVIAFFAFMIMAIFEPSETVKDNELVQENNQNSIINKSQEVKPEEKKIHFDGNLTTVQIDKICKTSLSEVNANSVSNYIKVSSNQNTKKYVYQSKETLYKYSCGFTGKDTFYINGVGWEDIIPRGTIYKSKTENCVKIDLYDPAFKITHNFNACN